MKARLAIVTPGLPQANAGNWRTAIRWRRMLVRDYAVSLHGPNDEVPPAIDLLIALHARRSAAAIRRFRSRRPSGGLILALTGTDVYRDIHIDEMAAHSLDLADRLIVLQPAALAELKPMWRARASVIYQSAPSITPGPRYRTRFDVVQIGHLRPEKDPFTPITALRFLPAASRIQLTQIGRAMDEECARLMEIVAREEPRLRWLGMLPHARARQRLKRAHLMVLASRMEGGAHVIIEAITSGVPVIASRVSGNIGMLGEDYAGYFTLGDAEDCARLMYRAETDPAFLARLERQCERRRPLFDPEREARALRDLVAAVLAAG